MRNKSHTVSKFSKFSKITLGLLYTGWNVVVHIYCRLSLRPQMAPQHSAKFRTASFHQFPSKLMKESVANYIYIRTMFRHLLVD